MWKTHFVNADPVTILQRLYEIKAQQDGLEVEINIIPVDDISVLPPSVQERIAAAGCD